MLKSGRQSGQAAARNLEAFGSLASVRGRELTARASLNNVTTASVSVRYRAGSKRSSRMEAAHARWREAETDLVRLVKR